MKILKGVALSLLAFVATAGVCSAQEVAESAAAVAGDAGCHACHTHMSCTERCPKELSPTASIAGLKRVVTLAAIKGDI